MKRFEIETFWRPLRVALPCPFWSWLAFAVIETERRERKDRGMAVYLVQFSFAALKIVIGISVIPSGFRWLGVKYDRSTSGAQQKASRTQLARASFTNE